MSDLSEPVPADASTEPVVPGGPVGYDTAEYQIPGTRLERRRRRITPMGVFAAAFFLLLLSAASVGIANFNAGSTKFAWTSIGLSAGAVVLTLVSFFVHAQA